MSSTNRGYERHKTDYYVTPQEVIHEFLDAFEQRFEPLNNEYRILDPCCGGDKENGASYLEVIKSRIPDAQAIGIDIRPDSHADLVGDFLEMDITKMAPDVIISNPPFYLSQEFIEHSLNSIET